MKKYFSEKVPDPDNEWRNSKIVLLPLNKDFEPIAISEEKVKVVAEFVGVMGK